MQFCQSALAGFLTGAGLIIAIGAQNAFVLRQGLKGSHVLLVVLCCIFGDVVCISAGTAGMGALVTGFPALMTAVRWGGALFLLTYALMAAQRAVKGGERLLLDGKSEERAGKVLAACLAFTFLNPHVYLDTAVLLGSLSAQQPVPWGFAAGAVTASVLWFVSLGYGAVLLRPVFARPAAWRVLDALIAVVMAVLGMRLLWE